VRARRSSRFDAHSIQSSLGPERIARFREQFDQYDTDNSGQLSKKEFAKCLKALGQNPTRAEIDKLMHEIDEDESGEVDFDEFCFLIHRYHANMDEEEELREAFRVFDKDNDGFVDRHDLVEIVRSLKWELTEEEIDDMVIESDVAGNGRIDFEEFCIMMNTNAFVGAAATTWKYACTWEAWWPSFLQHDKLEADPDAPPRDEQQRRRMSAIRALQRQESMRKSAEKYSA